MHTPQEKALRKTPTPFKIVKDMVVKGGGGLAKDVGKGIKKGGKAIGKVLHKHLIQPSVRHNKFLKDQDNEYRRKAESGEYNR